MTESEPVVETLSEPVAEKAVDHDLTDEKMNQVPFAEDDNEDAVSVSGDSIPCRCGVECAKEIELLKSEMNSLREELAAKKTTKSVPKKKASGAKAAVKKSSKSRKTKDEPPHSPRYMMDDGVMVPRRVVYDDPMVYQRPLYGADPRRSLYDDPLRRGIEPRLRRDPYF